MRTFLLIVQLARPYFLLGAALLYALGVGIGRYLGNPVDWGLYLLGQIWVSTLQLAAHFLNEYFDARADTENPHRTPFSGGSGALGPGKLPRPTALWLAVGCLTATASITFFMIRQLGFSQAILAVMLLALLAALLYSVPPVRLAASGYGELTTSVLVANLVPVFGFLLQSADYHRLLAMSTFPLTALHLAMMLTFELPDYASDLKFEKRTLMVRLGWQNGMLLHNVLILSTFALLGLAAALGMPLEIALPPLLLLPLGLLQIWTMNRIAAGGKPNWKTLTWTAVILFSLVAYLLTFSYWIR
jgi:1,4-dihydroxy-2-naphthoate octaprenyltransferase